LADASYNARVPPLFACFPVCLTFVALAIIGAIVVAFRMDLPVADPRPASPSDLPPRKPVDWSPVWIFPLMLLALTAVMLALRWYWPE